MLTCEEQGSLRRRLIDELKIFMTTINTHPHISEYLSEGLSSWFADPFGEEPCRDTDQEFWSVADSQDSLGWYATLLGLFHKDLLFYQSCHYKRISSRRTGTSWGKHMAGKLWNIIYQLWAARNECLHETNTSNEFKGLDALCFSITLEEKRYPNSSKQFIFTLLSVQRRRYYGYGY